MNNISFFGKNKKFLISILVGVFTLILSPYGIEANLGEIRIDISWILFLPILTSMAFGWRYGLVSGLSGGALFPFLIWANNGWVCLSTSIIYLCLYIIVGFVNETNYFKKIQKLPVRLILALTVWILLLSFYVCFLLNPILTLNPPFWNANSINNIPLNVIYGIAFKDSMIIIILSLVAETLLKLRFIRRLTGLPVTSEQLANTKIFTFTILLTFIVWLVFFGLDFIMQNGINIIQSAHFKLTFFVTISSGFIVARIFFFFNENQLITQYKLNRTEEKFKTLYENANDAILLIKEGVFVECNNTTLKLFACSYKDIIGNTPFFFSPQYQPDGKLSEEKAIQLISKAINGISQRFEWQHSRLDGTLFDAEISLNRIDINYEILLQAIVHDITERKLAEAELEEGREKYRGLSEAAFESIFISEKGLCIEQNKTAEKIFGYTSEEAIGRYGTDWIAVEDREKVMQNMLNGYEEPYEANALKKDGSTFPCMLQGKMMHFKGRNVRVTSLTDISSFKQIEENLRNSETQKAAILRIIPDLLFVFNENGDYLEVYTEDDSKLFISREKLIGMNISELFPVEMVVKAKEAFKQSLLKKELVSFPYSISMNGRTDFYEARILPSSEDKVFAIVRDITEQKQAEISLKLARKSYIDIFNSVSEAIYVLDETATFIDVNKGAEKMYGYSRKELIGQNPATVAAPDLNNLEEIQRKMQKVFETGNSECFIFWALRKNGEIFPKEVIVNKARYFEKDVLIAAAREITERYAAERALNESKEKYQKDLMFLNLIFESSIDIIIFSLDKNYCYTKFTRYHKETIKKIWGVEIEIGMNLLEIISIQEDREKAKHNFDKALQGEYFVLTEEYGDASLYRTYYENYYSSIKNSEGSIVGLSVFVIDVTERMKSQEKLKESEEKFKAIANYAASWEAWYNTKGKLIWMNSYSVNLTGYTPDEYMATDDFLSMIIEPEDFPLAYEKFQDAMQGTSGEGLEIRCLRKDGSRFWVSTSWRPILDSNGNSLGFRTSSQDISEKKKIMEDLILAKEKAEESDRLKTAFLNNISHEIRTPFNGLLGFLSMLQENELSINDRDKYIRNINISANRFLNTLNDIVEMSQIQAGQSMLTSSATNINNLIKELYLRFKAEAESKDLELNFNYEYTDKIELISIDKNKLCSILYILLGNAIKFTKFGSVNFGVNIDEESYTFYVKDTGVGIPQSKQHLIFDYFMQADISNTRAYEGSGLGLSIAKAYVEMLAGKIYFESEEGKGSVFYVSIPITSKMETLT
ncbi:MAG: PAS domain S-box protein [Bacteroidales bacterium]